MIGVGGTSIGAKSETAWNDSGSANGAGGGGVSSKWCMPSYQDQPGLPGLINPYSLAAPTDCGTKKPYMREVPDVSADADPVTGYVTYWDGSWQGGEGGTSAAAPLWAAAAALIDSSPYCADYGSNERDRNAVCDSLRHCRQRLLLRRALRRDAMGATPTHLRAMRDLSTHATKGYDMASGLGTPLLAYPGNYYPGLAALTCFDHRNQADHRASSRVSRRRWDRAAARPG